MPLVDGGVSAANKEPTAQPMTFCSLAAQMTRHSRQIQTKGTTCLS